MKGPEEVKDHEWLRDFNWDGLLKKEIVAPFIPQPGNDNFDEKQANGVDHWKEENEEQLKLSSIQLRRNSI